ncbi:unnamed protein product [Angiostrongylus costaricensis]|uniref:Cation_ATPase_C domain-containing protein n=1 Tax=Angiostrongylus costaricensis TaxID=334426 RepID=A0A0R3PBX8_ANGCS|nr:unnamed protein product [Angiostrongylus costaricensis]
MKGVEEKYDAQQVPGAKKTQWAALARDRGTAVFYVSVFQYITLVVVYSKGPPYRKTLFSNQPLCISIVFVTLLSLSIILWSPLWLLDFMGNVDLPSAEFRCLIVLIAAINAIFSFLFEKVFVERFLVDFVGRLGKPHVKFGCPDGVLVKSDVSIYDWILSRIGAEASWLTPRLSFTLRQ